MADAVERVTALRSTLAAMKATAETACEFFVPDDFAAGNWNGCDVRYLCAVPPSLIRALVAHAEGILDRHDDCTPGQCCYCTDERGRFLPWPCPEVVALCEAWMVTP